MENHLKVHVLFYTIKGIDKSLWKNNSWLVWRGVSSRSRDSSDTFQNLILFFFFVARRFMAGSQMLRQLYFSALDMELHTRYEAQKTALDMNVRRHGFDSRSSSLCANRFIALLTRRGFCVKFLGKLLYCVSISLQIGVEIEKHDTMLWLGEMGGGDKAVHVRTVLKDRWTGYCAMFLRKSLYCHSALLQIKLNRIRETSVKKKRSKN